MMGLYDFGTRVKVNFGTLVLVLRLRLPKCGSRRHRYFKAILVKLIGVTLNKGRHVYTLSNFVYFF